MVTIMNRSHIHPRMGQGRTAVQKVSIAMGVGFIVLGLAGILMPGFMGMHLSLSHDLIHLGSGALALWVGYSENPSKAYTYCMVFGVVYGLLGLSGFIIGQPGYPGVGHMQADQNLLRIIPNVLELGTMDHGVHVIISAALLLTGIIWKSRYIDPNHSLVNHEMGNVESNTDSDLSDVDLGKSDVNVYSDKKRREDFERRV